MRQALGICVVMAMLVTPAMALVDTFTYADGNLNGNGGWTGTDAGSIVVEGSKVKITSNATGKTEANLATGGDSGVVTVSFDYQQANGVPEFFADVYVRDAAGKYLGWMYMAPEGTYEEPVGTFNFAQGIVRGRGPEGIVVALLAAGDYTWHNYAMVINTATNTTEYFRDGISFGTRNQEAGSGDSVETIQLTSWNRGHTGSYGYFDNVAVVPEPATLGFLALGVLFVGRRRARA